MQTAPRDGFRQKRSLRDFYYVLFRHKGLLLKSFCLILGLTAVGTFLAPKIYQSDALLMVRLGRESVKLDPTAATGQILSISQSREGEVKTELEILGSEALAGQVVDSVGVDVFLSKNSLFKLPQIFSTHESDPNFQRNMMVREISTRLEVDVQKNSNILRVSFTAHDPHLAQDALNRFIALYLEKHIKVHRTPGSDDFFLAQTEQLRAKVAQTESELRDLKNETGVASIPEQRVNVISRISELRKDIDESAKNLASTKEKVQAVRKLVGDMPRELLRMKTFGQVGTNLIDYSHQRLVDIGVKEQGLLSILTPQHRHIESLRRQKGEVKSLLASEEGTRSQTIQFLLLSEEASIPEIDSRLQSLRADLAREESRLKELNNSEVLIVRLQRELDLQTTAYRNYAEKLEQTRIDRALEMDKISNISVVQSATLPVEPIRPRRLLNLAVGFCLGLCVSIGGAFLAEHLDHSIRTPDEIEERLLIPALATVPCLPDILRKKGTGNNGVILNESLDGPRVSPALLKYYEVLLNRITLSRNGGAENIKVIAVASCHPGEGASTIACNLAMALAENDDGRVLLVDANMGEPFLHELFRKPSSPGLTEAALNQRVNPLGIELVSGGCLDFLPSGRKVVSSAQLFDSQPFAQALAFWKQEYGYIVFDAGSIVNFSSTLRLLRQVDTTLLVLEAERTRFEVAQRVKELLEQSHAEIMGVVLNKRKFHIPRWFYRRI